jgi:hypothetical protein
MKIVEIATIYNLDYNGFSVIIFVNILIKEKIIIVKPDLGK